LTWTDGASAVEIGSSFAKRGRSSMLRGLWIKWRARGGRSVKRRGFAVMERELAVFEGVCDRARGTDAWASRAFADTPHRHRERIMNLLLAHSLFAVLTSVVPQARPDAPSANAVLHWNQVVTDTLAAAHTDPVTESRALAIIQVAVHDALNSLDARCQTYAPTAAPAIGASTDAAIAAAAHDALLGLMPSAKASLDEELSRSLQMVAEGEAKSCGLDVGRRIAAATLAARAHDGSDRKVELPAGTKPGEYRPTPPDFTPAWMAQWGGVTPFVLNSSAQFRPSAPPAVDSALARREVEQMRSIGGQAENMRSDEQSQIARFWYENSGQGWNRIARVVAQSRQLDEWQSARLLALVNLAMADGFISGFEAKYHYLYWRPATAIRAAGASEWQSYLGTPPVPDYPSTHSVLGGAAATVLARFFENDYVAFETTSGAPYAGLTRKFWSFSEAERENAASRVLAGIHFPTAVRVGCQLGEDVGTWVFEHALLPRDAKSAPVGGSSTALR
jgi:hypothetical protein